MFATNPLPSMPPKPYSTLEALCRWVIAACLIMMQVACHDPTAIRANLENMNSTVTVYALTGTPPGSPPAFSLPANQAVLIDGNLLFDVAFDVDAQSRVVLYPMKLVAWPRLEVHPVGLLKSDDTFDDIIRAPAGGYGFDDPMTAEVGDVIVVEAHESRACGFPNSPRLYAKFEVLEINAANRTVRLRVTNNPNCGFRSFLAGIPTD